MPDDRGAGVIFDGSFEGLLTVVYAYYYEKLRPRAICPKEGFQPALNTFYIEMETDGEHAARVLEAIRRKFAPVSVQNIYNAFLNRDGSRYFDIFRYIIAGFKLGRGLDDHMQTDYILKTQQLAKNTSSEAHLLKGFSRFRELDNGIYYSDISPNNDCLPILAEHFSDRFIGSPFVIHDVRRSTAVIYDGRAWILADVPPETAAELARKAGEDTYPELWRAFYDAIGIEERANPKLRRSLMPKRYWPHMPEMSRAPKTAERQSPL